MNANRSFVLNTELFGEGKTLPAEYLPVSSEGVNYMIIPFRCYFGKQMTQHRAVITCKCFMWYDFLPLSQTKTNKRELQLEQGRVFSEGGENSCGGWRWRGMGGGAERGVEVLIRFPSWCNFGKQMTKCVA